MVLAVVFVLMTTVTAKGRTEPAGTAVSVIAFPKSFLTARLPAVPT